MIPNATLIEMLLRELAIGGYTFRFNVQHSFVDNNRMRQQITFPELILQGTEIEIALTV